MDKSNLMEIFCGMYSDGKEGGSDGKEGGKEGCDGGGSSGGKLRLHQNHSLDYVL